LIQILKPIISSFNGNSILFHEFNIFKDEIIAESHIVEKVMNCGHSLDSIETIKLEISAIEGFRKVAVAWEVFLLNLKLRRLAVTVVHIVGLVGSRANIQSVIGVLRVSISHMELCLLLIA
jgi:uncharacterized membrane protein